MKYLSPKILFLIAVIIILLVILVWKEHEIKSNYLNQTQNPTTETISEEVTKTKITESSNSAPTTSHSATTSQSNISLCLPTNLTSDTVIYTINNHAVTVSEKLKELGGICNTNKILFDSKGKEIRFFKLTGCWGIPPNEQMRKVLEEQDVDLKALKETYTVVEISCNTSGLPTP